MTFYFLITPFFLKKNGCSYLPILDWFIYYCYGAGVYESFDTICIYLESDQSVGTDPDKNFWVRYRMAVVNQKNHAKTVWKESSICTKTWNNSVLQFMKVSDMLDADAGFLLRDTVVFVCEILDCCPWFEFSDLEVSICLSNVMHSCHSPICLPI